MRAVAGKMQKKKIFKFSSRFKPFAIVCTKNNITSFTITTFTVARKRFEKVNDRHLFACGRKFLNIANIIVYMKNVLP